MFDIVVSRLVVLRLVFGCSGMMVSWVVVICCWWLISGV